MKRIYIALTAALASMTGVLAIASAQAGTSPAQASTPAHASRATEVVLRHTHLGAVLADASGFTLYEFTRDRGDSDSCAKVSGCLHVWPALQSSGKPKAGSGMRASLLSTIKLSGGASQVTYAGHPLYLYSGDSAPGDTSYVGVSEFGGSWYAIDAAGGAVK
jgi:predicted lipoprotein with Yx(FWY)xxD motif